MTFQVMSNENVICSITSYDVFKFSEHKSFLILIFVGRFRSDNFFREESGRGIYIQECILELTVITRFEIRFSFALVQSPMYLYLVSNYSLIFTVGV